MTVIQTPWETPLLWRLHSRNALPPVTQAYDLAGAVRAAFLDALGADAWIIAQDRTGEPSPILTIPTSGRISAVGVAPLDTLSTDAIEILRHASRRVQSAGLGRELQLGRPVDPSVLSGPADTWQSLTPWVAISATNVGRAGKAGKIRRQRTPEQLLLEAIGKTFQAGATRSEAIHAAEALVEKIATRPVDHDISRPRQRHHPYVGHAAIRFKEPVDGPLMIGLALANGLGLMRPVLARR